MSIRLFSYKLKYDTGFAPNPFHGVCTLATCKAPMRRAKKVGDWIAGFTSVFLNGDPVGAERLVYLMQVSERLGFDQYFRSPAFAAKIPTFDAPRIVDRAGDNIYFLEGGAVRQVRNINHDESNMEDDLSGKFVLVGVRFHYFGSNPLVVPAHVRPTVPAGVAGAGYLTHDLSRAQAFIDFVSRNAQGPLAPPTDWPPDDESWRNA